MPPLLFQCLNSSLKASSSLRAAFSTSISKCADKPMPSATSVLADLGESFSKPSNSRFSARSSNSATLSIPPRRGGLRNTPSSSTDGHGSLTKLINQSTARQQRRVREQAESVSSTTAEQLEKDALSKALSKQIKRQWKVGDVYAPHDMSWQEQVRWRKNDRPKYDIFDITNFNPLDHYKNFSVLSEYVSPSGRILHSRATGLRPVNQRRIAKAIRRSIGMGMMPSVYRHPELLQKVVQRSEMQAGRLGGL